MGGRPSYYCREFYFEFLQIVGILGVRYFHEVLESNLPGVKGGGIFYFFVFPKRNASAVPGPWPK